MAHASDAHSDAWGEAPGEARSAPFAGPVVLITSPHARHAQTSERLIAMLEEVGVHVRRHFDVAELDDYAPQGAAWKREGIAAAVAAGGDGTVGMAATHLAGSGLPLGILPLGTANDVARSLEIPMRIEEACHVIAQGQTLAVDAGQVVPALAKPGALSVEEMVSLPQGDNAPSPSGGAYFLHAVTLGLNVEFARLATDAGRRARLRGLNYPASALEALAHFHPVRAKLRFRTLESAEERVIESSVLTVLTVNTPAFGGPLRLRLPGVAPHDRLLDFVIIEGPDPARLHARVDELREELGHLFEHKASPMEPTAAAGVTTGTPAVAAVKAPHERGLALPGVHHLKARSVLIETAEPVDLTIDGEIRTHTPALVRVAPFAVPLFVPASLLASESISASASASSTVEAKPA